MSSQSKLQEAAIIGSTFPKKKREAFIVLEALSRQGQSNRVPDAEGFCISSCKTVSLSVALPPSTILPAARNPLTAQERDVYNSLYGPFKGMTDVRRQSTSSSSQLHIQTDPVARERIFNTFLTNILKEHREQQKHTLTGAASSQSTSQPDRRPSRTGSREGTDSHHVRLKQEVTAEKTRGSKIRARSSHVWAEHTSVKEVGDFKRADTRKKGSSPARNRLEEGMRPTTELSHLNCGYSKATRRPGGTSCSNVPGIEGISEREIKRRTKREAEKKRETMLEYLENTVFEHAEELDTHTDRFEKINEHLQDVDQSVKEIIVDVCTEARRLGYENEELTRMRAEFNRVNMELDSIKRRIGMLPPMPIPYRRAEDPHGAPFAVWRRDPTRAAYRPPNINTRRAARCVDRSLPLFTQSVSPSEISLSGNSKAVGISKAEREHERRGRGDRTCDEASAQTKGKNGQRVYAPTNSKRAHDADNNDAETRSPPTKRLRNRDGFDWIGLAAHGVEEEVIETEDTPSLHTLTDSPYIVIRGKPGEDDGD